MWIPTLYFVEGIPYFLVNNVSVLMFAKMGVPNGQMALFTSLLYLPWTLKFLWSPFVDIIKTKRWWIITMQIIMSIAFVVQALTMPHPSAESIAAGSTPMSLFSFTLILFVFAAFASATHDIAADGFYMLAQSQEQPGGLCRSPQHVLQARQCLRQRCDRRSGRIAGDQNRQHPVGLAADHRRIRHTP